MENNDTALLRRREEWLDWQIEGKENTKIDLPRNTPGRLNMFRLSYYNDSGRS